jgi:predicted phage terminase large subunit-like protein
MDKTIEYHKLMVGAFENEEAIEENDELVIGNRWGYNDLNSHIREHESEFRVTTHSAMGGCCALHPPDQTIFPEEFNEVKLDRWRRRLGNYLYSCQFLNNPSAPENADFHPDDLRYFSLEKDLKNGIEEWTIHHEVINGVVKKNLSVNHLNLCLVADPNHSGNSGSGRCRHAINVVGLSSDGDFYLIDTWAQAASYDTFYAKIYEFSDKWKIRKLGVESYAAQKYILHHIDFTNRLEGRNLKVIPLEGEVDAGDGEMTKKKEFRIRNVLSPIFEAHKFYAQQKQQDFFGEFSAFPKGKYKDVLDALAYAPQMLRLPAGYLKEMMWKAANAAGARKINMPYSTGVN